MATVKLAQVYKTSVAAIFDQFRIRDGAFESLLLNRSLGLSWDEFKNVMRGQTVPFESVTGLSYDLFTALDWLNFTAEEWYGLIGSPNFLASKASLFLRAAGVADHVMTVDGSRVIDMTNHSAFDHGTALLTLDPDGTGAGSMLSYASDGNDETVKPTFSFPLAYTSPVSYHVWVRVKSNTTSVNFELLIDGQSFKHFTDTVTAGTWTWLGTRLLLPDTDAHTLTVRVNQHGTRFDKLYFLRDATTPTGTGPSYTASPYVTAHVQRYRVGLDQKPTTALYCYDAKTTAAEVIADDWYNFNTVSRKSDASTDDTEYAIVLAVSGGSDSHFLVWDLASPSEGMPAAAYDGSAWTVDDGTNHAVLLYSNKDSSSGCAVVARPAQEFDLWVRNFRPEDAKFINTRLTTDEYDPSGQVVIDTPKRVLSFVIDESGSNTWNDPDGARHDTVRRIVSRLDKGYPEDVSYNVLSFGSKPVVPVLFGSTTEFRDGTALSIAQEFFLRNSTTQVAGVRVVRKLGSFPETPIDGVILKDGIFNRFRDEGLTEGADYFYSVFTYNQNYGRFSAPKRVVGVPRARVLPMGVSFFDAAALTGTGVVVDDETLNAWHFVEGDGIYVHDFSNLGMTLTFTPNGSSSRPPFWSRQETLAMGRSALRLNGIDECAKGEVTTDGLVGHKFTVMAWVNWYAGMSPIITRQSATTNNYSFSVNGFGRLEVLAGDSAVVVSTGAVTANRWTHVAVTVDTDAGQAKFYIDGILDSTQPIAQSNTGSGPMRVIVGSNYVASNFFFGVLTEVSVHSSIRTDAYIAAAAVPNTNVVQDNGDRVVTFDWLMDPAASGTVQIVRGRRNLPSSVNDGTVVYDADLTGMPGEHHASHSTRFRVFDTAYYRIFVRNAQGNYSTMEDSAGATVEIPSLPPEILLQPLTPPLSPAVSFSVTPHNKKVLLEWQFPNDQRASGVMILRDTEAPPVVEGLTDFSGDFVYLADRSESSAVVGVDKNDVSYYFSIVTFDNLGHVSATRTDTATASEAAGDFSLPPPPVNAFRAEPVSTTSVELVWENPTKFYEGVQVYIGDRAFAYGVLLDEYGDVLTNVTNLRIDGIGSLSADSAEDVFGDFGTGQVGQDNFSISSFQRADGLARAVVRFDNNSRAVNKVAFAAFQMQLAADFQSADALTYFSYRSGSVNVVYKNPLEVTITNLNSDFVPMRHRGLDGFVEELVPGAFARRDGPVVLRVSATYRGLPVASLVLNTRQGLRPDTGDTSLGDVQVITATAAFTDVLVPASQTPTWLDFYARTAVGGFARTNKFALRFENPLRIEMTAKSPKNDGSDVAEQFATAYYVDPNDPTTITMVPNLTLVRWEVSDGKQAFYSTDNTRQPNGVYSFVRDGVARKVYFGPVTNIPETGEGFTLKTTVVFDGLVARDSVSVFVRGASQEVEFSGQRFLSEFPDVVNDIWADGKDYARLTIVHDPTSTVSRFSSCFLSCSTDIGNEVIPLAEGQQVQIDVGDAYEIIWGDVIEYASSGDGSLDTSNAQSSIGTAVVPLSAGDVTYVYFRINRAVSPTEVNRFLLSDPRCDCFKTEQKKGNAASAVTLATSVFHGGDTVPLRSGGSSAAAMPALVLNPKEPLDISVVDLRVDGFPSDVFVVDGETVNEIIVEVSWRGGPVPNGTPVKITPSADSTDLQFEQTTVTTVAQLDPLLNPDGPVRSFASIKVLPLSPAASIIHSFTASATYDESGNVVRQQEALVSILYTFLSEPDRRSQVISDGFYRYGVSSGLWSTLPSLNHPRGALSLAYVNGNFYAIGGSNGRSVSVFNEKYNGTSWSNAKEMPTPRAYAQTVVNAGKIYVIGGITVDGLTDKLVVSRAVEVYDPSSNSWTTLTSMPLIDVGTAEKSPYGVAMGCAVVSGGNVYVASGLRDTFVPQEPPPLVVGQTLVWNDRVLRYNIASDTWSYSDTMDEEVVRSLFARAGGFVVLDGTSMHVIGGGYAVVREVKDELRVPKNKLVVELRHSAYSLDVSGTAQVAANSLASSDPTYRDFPVTRYKGASVQVGNAVYLVGGTSEAFPTTNVFESFDTSQPNWPLTTLAPMILGLHSAGVATDGTDVFVAGGMGSGRGPEFLQINLTLPGSMRLDGRQSLTMKVDVRDRNNHVPSNVDLLFTASLNNFDIGTSGFQPVALRFAEPEVEIQGDVATNVLLPRSEDLLPSDDKFAAQKEGVVGEHVLEYPTFVIDAVVRDTTYKGRTAKPETVDDKLDSGVIGSGKIVSLRGSRNKNTVDRGVFFSGAGYDLFNLLPKAMPSGASTLLKSYSDIPWVPYVDVLVGDNAGNSDDVRNALTKASHNVPFGCSPLMDAIRQAVFLMQEDNGFPLSKTLYALSDANDNLDQTPEADVEEDLKALVGRTQVPFIGIDLSMQSPLLEASTRQTSADPTMEKLAANTGGQTIAILSATHLDDIVNDATGGLLGTVGHGLFEYVVDIIESSMLKRISLDFVLPTNSSASWKYAFSEDGFEYSAWSEPLDDNDIAEFDGITSRYIKFLVSLSSGLTTYNTESQETLSASPSPALDAINIVFHKSLSDYLYLKARQIGGVADDVVLAVNADLHEATELLVGVSTYDNQNWDRFDTAAAPAEDQNGKLVLPYRVYTASAEKREQLIPLDGFMLKAQYGRWQPNAVVTVYDASGVVVDADTYNVNPDAGTVVFKERIGEGAYYFSLADEKLIKLGLKITSRDGGSSVTVRGAGAMYTER